MKIKENLTLRGKFRKILKKLLINIVEYNHSTKSGI